VEIGVISDPIKSKNKLKISKKEDITKRQQNTPKNAQQKPA
jgi:hypothetical protein